MTQQIAPASQPADRVPWLAAALLAFATLAAYSAALTFPFIRYDDPDYTTGNLHVKAGVGRAWLAWALTSFDAANWFPLTWLSHTLDWSLWGAWAPGHHLTSLLLHAANGVLLFTFLWRATGRTAPSLAAAVFFAIHPLRVESVVWVAERKDVLSGFFFFWLLHAWLSYTRRPTAGRYAAILALHAAGLASKQMLVTTPIVLLLVDGWPLDRLRRGSRLRPLLLEKLPLVALSLVAGILTLRAQSAGRAVVALAALPLAERLGNAVIAAGTYLWLTVQPVSLSVFYPRPAGGLASRIPELVASLALLVLLSSLALRQRREHPELLVGLAWFAVAIAPVIGLVQVGAQTHADRYTYLPMVGPAAGLLFALPWPAAEHGRSRAGRLALAVAGLLFALTLRQVGFWRDTPTLFLHALAVAPDNPVAESQLATVLLEAGQLDRAEVILRRSAERWPDLAWPPNGLGTLLAARGRCDQAEPWFLRAMRADPRNPDHAVSLATCLLRLRRPAEVLALLAPFAAQGAGDPTIQQQLGLAYGATGDQARATEHLARAVALDPSDARWRINLGAHLANQGRLPEAIAQFEAALANDPGSEQARQLLEQAGIALARQRRSGP